MISTLPTESCVSSLLAQGFKSFKALLAISCVWVSSSAISQAQTQRSGVAEPARSSTIEANQKSRQQLSTTLQTKLEAATTSAQKQAAVDEYRAAMESQMQQVVVPTEPEVAPAVLIARMKASAGNDAQQMAQVARLEKTFQDQAELQAKLAAINEAQGAAKQQLVDELRATQEAKVKEREAEAAQSGVALADADDEQTAKRSPELDARLAKVKKQQEDFDQTMAAVDQASSPADKARLIDAWRAQMEAEMAARAAELQHLEVP